MLATAADDDLRGDGAKAAGPDSAAPAEAIAEASSPMDDPVAGVLPMGVPPAAPGVVPARRPADAARLAAAPGVGELVPPPSADRWTPRRVSERVPTRPPMLGDELASTSRATLTGRAMTGAAKEPAELPATMEAVTAGTGEAAACSALGSACAWS
jgi:hypothetical protein